MHEKKERLGKVANDRRDFMRKVAMGSAYAVPVMASFPLDSVRMSARAQGVYGDPAVVNIRGVAAADFNPRSTGVTIAADTPSAYWVITFDRPMNRNFKNAMWSQEGTFPCGAPEADAVERRCEDLDPGKCGGEGEGWSWTKDATRLYRELYLCRGEAADLEIVLNPGGRCEAEPFQDRDGRQLGKSEGCVTYCQDEGPPCG